MNCIFKLWPIDELSSSVSHQETSAEALLLETPVATTHTARSIAPARPFIPSEIPDDNVIEDEIDWDFAGLSKDFGEDLIPEVKDISNAVRIVEQPDRTPRVRRIVEAVTPAEARDLDYRVEVTVNLLVMPDGSVADVTITDIVKIFPDERRESVDAIGFGIMEASMRAAALWQFIPALYEGEQVGSYSVHRFIF
ncbi:MAG: energy transducer TonB [Balneolales bacterium]|nr:energy transducer TonB [Balneolales bacterium]